MKNIFLTICTILLINVSNAQFTQLNEPLNGEGTTLYVIDSNAVNFDSITGLGVEWDYSGYGGYNGEARNITILDPTQTMFAQNFPISTSSTMIQDFFITYTTSSANERVSQGFVYSEINLGDVIVTFDLDESIQYVYPFDVGDSQLDTYQGTLDNASLGTHPVTGQIRTSVDGQGTLKLANGVTLNDVYRYKIEDIATVTVTGTFIFDGIYELERKQFEYYDLNNSNVPVFVYTTVDLRSQGSTTPLSTFNLAMSSEDPTFIAGVNIEKNSVLNLFPNPASETLMVYSPNAINTQYWILDGLGRKIGDGEMNGKTTSIDVSWMNKGFYVINFKDSSNNLIAKKFRVE
jgi:hypothetical protein